MAQHDYNIANASFPTVRTDINNVLSAINTCNSGSSRPSGAVAGTIWLNTSGGATAHILTFFDGTHDITLGTINTTANTVDWSDSSVTGTIAHKTEGTNFVDSLLVGHATTGTLSTASFNTGVGIDAMDAITSGDYNTFLGFAAGTALTGSGQNTAVGANAMIAAPGSYNTALGATAGYSINASGHYNTLLGKGAGSNITSGDANVIIGAVDADSATGNHQLKITGYDGSTTTTWISGDSNGQVKLISGYVLEVALTDATTITWNAATQPVAKVTLTANRIMGLPSNPVSGQFISILLIQDAGGTNTITWNAAYEFTADTAPTLTSTGNLGDMFTFRYNGAKWLEVGRNLALTLS